MNDKPYAERLLDLREYLKECKENIERDLVYDYNIPLYNRGCLNGKCDAFHETLVKINELGLILDEWTRTVPH